MKDITKYISIIAVIVGLYSCSLKEEFMPVNRKTSVEFVARLTGFNNVDITTKSAPTEEFETAVYTAYFLLFDSSTGARIAVDSVDVSSGSLSQTIVGKMPGPVTACFIANIPQGFAAKNLTSLTALNSAVLDITYATYSEAGGYLGVPKITVNGETKLCIPMFGSKNISNINNGGNIEIPVKRMFAKISMNIKMQLTSIGIGQIAPTTVNYELKQYQLLNLPTKVRLVGNDNENETTYESGWADNSSAFIGNNLTPVSSGNNLGLQTININDSDSNTDNDSTVVPGIDFCFYVPEYYLQPISEPNEDQKYKPLNYDYEDKYAIYVELEGEVNRSLIDNTGIRHNIYLGGDNTKNFILKKNLNYINRITIRGIENNIQGTEGNIDHRVSTDIVNNPVAQAGKAANCYIIAKPGEYTIPAYKGAYNNLNGATLCMSGKNLSEYETRVEVLANVVEYENLTNITFSAPPTYDPETNTISFTVDPMLNNENWVPNGSVIMALQYRKKGETQWTTEWSWHLWFVFNITASEDGWGTIGYQTMPDGKHNMMDRNLGVHALTNAGRESGFYYRYGEHAPYLDPDGDGVYTQYGGGSIGNSAPAWTNNEKSVTDPCPPGYKVPASSVWNTDIEGQYSALGYIYYDNIYYPFSGYMKEDFTIESKITPPYTYNGFDKTQREYTLLGTGLAFKEVEYSLPIDKQSGAFNTCDGRIIYEAVDAGIVSKLSIKKFQYAVKTWFGYRDWKEGNPNIEILGINLTDLLQSLKRDIESTDDVKNLTKSSLRTDYSSSSHGYQVRCVSETPIKSN